MRNLIRRLQDRSGVALIITLGLLALLLLLSFTFAVSMQTERQASEASADGLQARQSVLQVMARVIADLRERVLKRTYTNREDGVSGEHRTPYPPRDSTRFEVRWSGGTGTRNSSGFWIPHGAYCKSGQPAAQIPDLPETLRPWMPLPFRDAACAYAANNMYWKTFFHFTQMTGYKEYACINLKNISFVQSTPICFAALTANCSGFLDPHLVGKNTTVGARRLGTNVAEIVINDLQDFGAMDASAWTDLTPDLPAESYPELVERLLGQGATDPQDPQGLAGDFVFFPYSHFKINQYFKRWSDTDTPPAELYEGDLNLCAYIGGKDFTKWSKDSELYQSFYDAGFNDGGTSGYQFPGAPNSVNSDTLCNNLVSALKDYVDDDFQPNNNDNDSNNDFEWPSQEFAPAVNEITIITKFTCRTNSTLGNFDFSISNSVLMEVWQPYVWDPKQGSDNYLRTYRLNVKQYTLSDGTTTKSPLGSQNPVKLKPRSFAVQKLNIPGGTAQWTSGAGVSFASGNKALITVTFPEIYIDADFGQGFKKIDAIKGNIALTNDIFLASPPSNATPIVRWFTNSYECLDPRFNYDPKAVGFWRARESHTLSNVNVHTMNYVTNSANYADGDTLMYTANKPVRTLGELGYLAYSPWKTVRLLDRPAKSQVVGLTDHHRVLDTFTLTSLTNRVAKGFVNPNSEHIDAVACVFNRMPVDNHPDDPAFDTPPGTGPRIAWAAARDMATTIDDYVSGNLPIVNGTGPYIGNDDPPKGADVKQFFWNVSDMGRVTNMVLTSGVTSITNEFQREAILRNSCHLFNTRQTLFTSLLVSTYVKAPYKFERTTNYNADWQYYINENAYRSAERRTVAVIWMDPWTTDMFVRLFKYLDLKP